MRKYLLGLIVLSYYWVFVTGTCIGQGPNTPEKSASVRMGCGKMTFDTVPGWGLRPDGNSAIGPTHGSVVIDKAGHIYTSADQGVFVFSPEGKVIHSYLGTEYSKIHDLF